MVKRWDLLCNVMCCLKIVYFEGKDVWEMCLHLVPLSEREVEVEKENEHFVGFRFAVVSL